MKRSTDRILTTHVGSLPRPPELVAAMRERLAGGRVDEAAFAARVEAAVAEAVKRQCAAGLDIVSDGEMGKIGFIPYINERLAGFEPDTENRFGLGGSYWGRSREVQSFPGFYDWASKQPGTAGGTGNLRLVCTGPIAYRGQAALRRDMDTLKTALKGMPHEEAFMPAISPANLEDWHRNVHYERQEDYLYAIADALAEEYKAIVAAGFLLQIDDPLFATYYVLHPELSVAECRDWAARRVEALNHALRGIPEESIRYHTCYSINMGPRVHDMELKDLIDLMLRIRAGAYSFEAANPRHDHEWKLWREVRLPEGKSLVPGVITHSSVVVEHPELVADRLCNYASAVGRENVIAGADCGFASFATTFEIHPEVVWAKFGALAEGARLASARLRRQ
jgi:5-methyltetrahydropteroyltriglutamate--homocysteine methyltransferase